MTNEESRPKEEIVKVNCSYCEKEIECPEDMLNKVEKHACLDCFKALKDSPMSEGNAKIHVDMPVNEALENIAEEFTDKMTKEMMPQLWAEHKEEIKEMSKKELAEKMFGEGIYVGFIGALAYLATQDQKHDAHPILKDGVWESARALDARGATDALKGAVSIDSRHEEEVVKDE